MEHFAWGVHYPVCHNLFDTSVSINFDITKLGMAFYSTMSGTSLLYWVHMYEIIPQARYVFQPKHTILLN